MPDNCTNSTVPDWLLRWDSRVVLPYGGKVWHPLLSLLTNSNEARIRLKQIEAHISDSLRELLRAKFSTISKFRGRLTSIDDLRAAVSEDAAVTVWDSKSAEDLTDLFLALGERFVLYLAITSAVRQALMVHGPFVAENVAAKEFLIFLDMPLTESCQKFLEKLSQAR